MTNLGAITLGNNTSKDFLRGLIPSEWKQTVYENNTYWSIECMRDDNVTSENYVKKDSEFDNICNKLIKEFGKNLMEIYSITSAGVHFIVYLKK